MQIKDFLNRLDEDKRKKLGEIIRFVVVGALATILQYGIYLILVRWLNESISMTVGYALSFIFNFFATTYFTFKVKANAKRGAGFIVAHVVNYLLQMLTLNLFIHLGVSKELAPIPMFCVCVPVNFILVRFFVKKK